MTHLVRTGIALVSAALFAAPLFLNMEGYQPALALQLSLVVLLLVAAILYLDVIFARLNARLFLGTAAGAFLGLVAGAILHFVFGTIGIDSYEVALITFIVTAVLGGYLGWLTARAGGEQQVIPGEHGSEKILDTSVIIDGRILDIAETNFLEGPFVIPNFVLREIQLISDSPDPVKRNRGRRGLEMLNKLQNHSSVKVKISYKDYVDIREVDAKLVRMARESGNKLITNDFNLSMVAELQGVCVLNLNNLTNALKPVVLPGEDILIDVIKEGKDENQGIGYLEDGTMVVIENGGALLGKSARVNVTSIIQTAAGKMIFTRAVEVVETQNQDQNRNGGRRDGHRRHRDRGEGEDREMAHQGRRRR